MFAAEHRGVVQYGGLPLPGAAITATSGGKTFRAVSGLDGGYLFPALDDGAWQLQVEMLCFAVEKRDVVVAPGTAVATWELKLLPLAEMKAAVAPPRANSGFNKAEVKQSAAHKASEKPAEKPAAQAEAPTELADRAADGLLINGSVNNGANSPFSQMPAFGNGRKGPRSMYNWSLGLVVDNSALDARAFSLTGQDTLKPAYNRVTGLVSFGGPLKIPRLFSKGPNVTVNYQWTRNRNATTQSGLMPTAAEREGFLASGVIAASRISPQAKALMALYPLPNLDGGARYNYQIPVVNAMHQDNLQSRFNQSFKSKNQISGSFAYMSSRGDNQNIFQFLDTTNSTGINAGLSYRRNVTTRYLVTVGVQFSRLATQITPFFSNRTNIAGAAGITGNEQSPQNWGPPALQFANGISGLSDAQAAMNRNQTADLSTSQFWGRGRHNVSFGADYKRLQFNVLSQQDPRGTFGFTTSGLAGFLLGTPDTSSIAYGNADKYLRGKSYDAFVTDDWRISPGFTLNAGARWEYNTPLTEKYGRLVNLAIAPGFTSQTAQVPGELHSDRIGVQPRIGISWRPFLASSMVVRAGYGVYYNSSVYQPIANMMSQQAPLSKSLSVQTSAANPLTLANGFQTSAGITRTTFAVDPDLRVGYAQSWQLSVQRDLPRALVMTATYLGLKGTRGSQLFLPNTYPAGSAAVPCATCPTGFTYMASNGNSTREAGMLQLRRRLQRGFTASTQYTYAKAIDDSALGGRNQGGQLIAQDWTNLSGERGRSNFDQRHMVTAMVQYTSSMAQRSQWFREWTLSSQVSAGSGLPLTPIYISAVRGTGVTGSIRPDYTGADLYAGTATHLNPLAYAPPASGRWGNAGRNTITGPGQFNLSASLARTFRVGDKLSLDVRADATNPLNHVTYPSWNATINSVQFGLPMSANQMRMVQTTLRLRF